MEHIQVTSNLIASLAYDGQSVMQILFKRGGLYAHEGVTLEDFERVLNPGAEHEFSVGKAYNAIVKAKSAGVKIEGGNGHKATEPQPSNYVPGGHRKDCDCMLCGLMRQSKDQAPTSEPPAVLPAEAVEVNRKSLELTQQAQEIVVDCPAAQAHASEILLVIASMRKEIETTFKPMKDAAYKAHKVVCDQEKAVDAPLATAERTLKERIGAYVLEQKRLAREAEEAARKAEQERAEAEAKAAAVNQAIEQAIELESRGELEAAQHVLASPAPVPVRYVAPAPVAPQVASVKGVNTRVEWTFRVTNIDLIPREYLLVNESAIAAVVKRTNGKVKIAGIETFETTVTAASRGRR